VSTLRTDQNEKNTLAKLDLLLLWVPDPSPKVRLAAEALQTTLKQTF